MRLVIKMLRSAEEDFRACNYPKFDGNPGDDQCQVRAICLLYLTCYERESLLEEFSLSNKKVSLSFSFLMQAYLSEIFREPYTVESTGRTWTRGNPGRIDRVEPGFKKLSGASRKILEYNQTELSALSAELLQKITKEEVFPRKIRTELKDKTYSATRTFTSLFHTTRAALRMLCQMRSIVCVQEIVPKTTERVPREFFFQAPESLESIWPLISPPTGPFMVIQVVMQGELEGIIEYFKVNSLARYFLHQVATSCPPYDKGSTIEDIPDVAAQAEVRSYQIRDQPPLFDLDHYFIDFTGRQRRGIAT